MSASASQAVTIAATPADVLFVRQHYVMKAGSITFVSCKIDNRIAEAQRTLFEIFDCPDAGERLPKFTQLYNDRLAPLLTQLRRIISELGICKGYLQQVEPDSVVLKRITDLIPHRVKLKSTFENDVERAKKMLKLDSGPASAHALPNHFTLVNGKVVPKHIDDLFGRIHKDCSRIRDLISSPHPIEERESRYKKYRIARLDQDLIGLAKLLKQLAECSNAAAMSQNPKLKEAIAACTLQQQKLQARLKQAMAKAEEYLANAKSTSTSRVAAGT